MNKKEAFKAFNQPITLGGPQDHGYSDLSLGLEHYNNSLGSVLIQTTLNGGKRKLEDRLEDVTQEERFASISEGDKDQIIEAITPAVDVAMGHQIDAEEGDTSYITNIIPAEEVPRKTISQEFSDIEDLLTKNPERNFDEWKHRFKSDEVAASEAVTYEARKIIAGMVANHFRDCRVAFRNDSVLGSELINMQEILEREIENFSRSLDPSDALRGVTADDGTTIHHKFKEQIITCGNVVIAKIEALVERYKAMTSQ